MLAASLTSSTYDTHSNRARTMLDVMRVPWLLFVLQQVMQHLTPSGSIACVPRPSSLWQRSRQPSGVPPVEQGPSSQSHYDWDDADNVSQEVIFMQ